MEPSSSRRAAPAPIPSSPRMWRTSSRVTKAVSARIPYSKKDMINFFAILRHPVQIVKSIQSRLARQVKQPDYEQGEQKLGDEEFRPREPGLPSELRTQQKRPEDLSVRWVPQQEPRAPAGGAEARGDFPPQPGTHPQVREALQPRQHRHFAATATAAATRIEEHLLTPSEEATLNLISM